MDGARELFNHAPLLANVLLHSREAVICGFWQGLLLHVLLRLRALLNVGLLRARHSAAPWRRAEVFEKSRSGPEPWYGCRCR